MSPQENSLPIWTSYKVILHFQGTRYNVEKRVIHTFQWEYAKFINGSSGHWKIWKYYFECIIIALYRKYVLIGWPGWLEKGFFKEIDFLLFGILDTMKRDTNVTRKTGQKQPYFTPFCTVELILKPHIEILDNLWYQTILLGYLIGLRANLIVMANWKSLYCPSAWLKSNYVYTNLLLPLPKSIRLDLHFNILVSL